MIVGENSGRIIQLSSTIINYHTALDFLCAFEERKSIKTQRAKFVMSGIMINENSNFCLLCKLSKKKVIEILADSN